ncbi:sugar phosphate isomerase/epimerase family protein [Streptomyces litchfieldiae]|uniref:Sugar phosphate isomerase/epimerase n=1 Tax=Streptomyces litchfieldiae TaxID=3075543 RepID=A0ABU2MW58_9ACTN|nr:sugar phosphate isomerase/epimerase [Streptomyces sp. DSM 44938]MDT0345877.1 sugar phosphate isomerase/epimerase [Streptomyces sp. DSM 44938]
MAPLGVQLYTVRDALSADRDATLGRIAEIGFTAVEPYDPTADPEGFKRVADDLGLTVMAIHAGQLLGDEPERVLDAIATLGTDLAFVPAGIPHEEFTTRDGLARTADLLNGLAGKAAGHGIRLGYHNHWWEIEPVIDGRHAIEILADQLAPEVLLELDTYWAAVGGADVPALLERLGSRVVALHVKDGPVKRDEPHVAVGQGAMPVPEILAAAPGALRIVELDTCATDFFDALAVSRAYLTELEAA